MAGGRRSSGVRQLELTDAALHIIATRGITALGTRTLAERVGLSSGAIYRHFASLDELLEAVVARVEAVLDATYPPCTQSPLDRLVSFVEARSSGTSEQLGILRLVLSDQFRLALPQGGSERLSACVHRTRDFIVECLQAGQDAGQIRCDVLPENLAPIVLGTLQVLTLSTVPATAPPTVLASDECRSPAVGTQHVRDALVALLRPPLTSVQAKRRRFR